jgi:hypothetical protein
MSQRPKNKASTAASRQGRRISRRPAPWPDRADALSALARAWTVTVIASSVLFAALALAPVWDRAIFLQGLRDALSGDPQLTEPVDAAPADAASGFDTRPAP